MAPVSSSSAEGTVCRDLLTGSRLLWEYMCLVARAYSRSPFK